MRPTKADLRVLASGVPASHAPTRTKVRAVAVSTCWQWVFRDPSNVRGVAQRHPPIVRSCGELDTDDVISTPIDRRPPRTTGLGRAAEIEAIPLLGRHQEVRINIAAIHQVGPGEEVFGFD